MTSLTRPEAKQPKNAHKLSVHPAGMAVDLRVPADGQARAFIERSLLEMERAGVLDVTRERSPAHYHIAVFADGFAKYAAKQDSLAAIERTRRTAQQTTVAPPVAADVPPPADGGSLPGFLLGTVALVGLTVPVMYRASKGRAV